MIVFHYSTIYLLTLTEMVCICMLMAYLLLWLRSKYRNLDLCQGGGGWGECKCDTNRAGHFTLDAHASRPVACFSTLRPKQNGRHLPDDIFKYILLNENAWIPIKISLKFVPKGPTNNIPVLVQIMVWRRPGAKPLSEPMMGHSLTHIWVTQPQWV